MARAFSVDFYKSDAWENCRASYLAYVGGLCEECLKQGIYTPAMIVHHRIHLTPENINDPEITLAFSNLEAVCRDCHGKVHRPGLRYKIAPNGAVLT
jgi:5-methylcytosine-specific restriction endonuclease McrA